MFRVKMRNPYLIKVSVAAASTVEKPNNLKVSSEEVHPGVDPPAIQEAEVALVIGPYHLVSTAGLLHLPLLAGQAHIIRIEDHPQKEERSTIVLTGGTIRPRMSYIALSKKIHLPPVQMELTAHTVLFRDTVFQVCQKMHLILCEIFQ